MSANRNAISQILMASAALHPKFGSLAHAYFGDGDPRPSKGGNRKHVKKARRVASRKAQRAARRLNRNP